MGFENAKNNLGDTNLNIPQPVFRNMLQNHINPNKKHDIIKVYQQYYEHMVYKVITVDAGGSQCRHYN